MPPSRFLARRAEPALAHRDITYVPTDEGWLSLAAALDLFSRKAVGWAMRDHLRTELPLAALTMAVQRQRPTPGLLHHSDRAANTPRRSTAKP